MDFDAFWRIFAASDYALAMKNTQENSPWHRESSVWEHTRMLISWYDQNLSHNRAPKQQMLSRVASAFHDTGKPPAMIVKHSPERGEYRAFHGHEQLSARIWVDFATSNMEVVTRLLGFGLVDVSNIALMIEHHVPFAMKDKRKRTDLKNAFISRMGHAGIRAWLDFLLSDQHGRIADDQATKLAAVDAWMVEWDKV
jgi:hypothetical protein